MPAVGADINDDVESMQYCEDQDDDYHSPVDHSYYEHEEVDAQPACQQPQPPQQHGSLPTVLQSRHIAQNTSNTVPTAAVSRSRMTMNRNKQTQEMGLQNILADELMQMNE